MSFLLPGASRWPAAFLAAGLSFGAAAAVAATETRAPPAPDEKAAKQTQLQGVEDTLKASEEQRRKIEAEVEAIKVDRARLSSALIETTAKVQQTEGDRAATNDRLVDVTARADKLAASLEARRGAIADVLAALQRMGRHPPPAILVRPADMAAAIRAAMVLGATLPALKGETEALARDLAQLGSLRADMAAQRDKLAEYAKTLAVDKARLTELISARQQSLEVAESALTAERKRAGDLASQATTLKDLIARMQGPGRASEADQAAAAEIIARAAAARGGDPARLKPAVAFADAKGQLALPVAGAILKTFGSPDAYGGEEKGVSIATPVSATVSTPIDGWVVYAGPYRTYGQLLILNAGGGYYMVLAGMDRINVTVGQFILAGEPVAVMGDGAARTAAAAAIGAAQPVLYIELRKNETAIDPGPWWAKANIEKARG